MRPINAFIAAFAATTAVSLGIADAEPLKLCVQYSVGPGYVTPMIPHVPKDAQPLYGKSYIVEPVFIQGSSGIIKETVVAKNHVDMSLAEEAKRRLTP